MRILPIFNLRFQSIALSLLVIMLSLGAAIAPASADNNDTTNREGLPQKTVPGGTYFM